MTWEGFWLPNLLQATVFAALAAAVGLLFRRWFGGVLAQIFGEQLETKHLAEAAASRSHEAVEQARKAADGVGDVNEYAKTAADNSKQTNEAVVFLATELGKANDRGEYLAEQVSDLFGALARERARSMTGPIPRSDAFGEDAATVTGRHRLHTQLMQTFPQDTITQETT